MRTHADKSAAVMQRHALSLQAVSASPNHLGNALVKGITEGDVADDATLEEREGPDTLGAVNDLVRDDEIAGLDLLLQATDSRESDDGADTDGAKGGNVSARGHLMRGDLVVSSVAAKERNSDGLVLDSVVQDGYRGGGGAPWR